MFSPAYPIDGNIERDPFWRAFTQAIFADTGMVDLQNLGAAFARHIKRTEDLTFDAPDIAQHFDKWCVVNGHRFQNRFSAAEEQAGKLYTRWNMDGWNR